MPFLQEALIEQRPPISSVKTFFRRIWMLTGSPTDLVMRPCGHVACKTCTETLVRSSGECVACDQQLKPKDILDLRREGIQILDLVIETLLTLFSGTGFAGGGLAETSKTGVAFQG